MIVAVGLVYISRSFSNSLKGIQSVESYALLEQLAQSVWMDIEVDILEGSTIRWESQGRFEPPYEAFQWLLEQAPVSGESDAAVEKAIITLKISRVDENGSALTQYAVLPAAVIPEQW